MINKKKASKEMNTDTVNRSSEGAIADVNALMPQEECGSVYREEQLKRKINNLLWEELPGTTTIEIAEKIACDIFYRILKGK
jgi:hypothetical protein